MSFFGSLLGDITRPIGRAITGFSKGGFAGAASGFASGVVSDITGGGQAPVSHPTYGGPANFSLPVPINRGGGNVSIPFLGPTHVPGPAGQIGQGFQSELSNLTGIPVSGSGGSSVSTGSGIKTVVTHRAVNPGDVIVHFPNGSIQAMPKEVARHLVNPATGKKLWKPTPKPAVSHHDMVVARKYKSVEKKLKSLGSKLDLKTEHKYAHRNTRSRKPASEAIIIKETK